jgi:signal transduction histidine kinase
MMNRATDPLVRAVSRSRATVHAKLLVGFLGMLALLVVVMVLGLSVLGQSNNRLQQLGKVQLKSIVYQELVTDSAEVRHLLTLRRGSIDSACWANYVGCVRTAPAQSASPSPSEGSSTRALLAIDQSIASALGRLIPATNESRLGFQPSSDEKRQLAKIRDQSTQLSSVMQQITDYDEAGAVEQGVVLQIQAAENIDYFLDREVFVLVNNTVAQTEALKTENASAFDQSRALLIAVAAAATILALLLGYVLSWSVVGPIRQIETRLGEITAGDFTGQVTVRNRDELGALAANINLMNDELGRLYQELESASRHKSEFLASMSHELRTPLNAVIGFSQVLRQQMFGELNEKQLEYVDDILGSGQHLLNLINDILDLAKVEAGRMELQPAAFALDETLRNATAMVRERATRQDVTLSTEIDDSVGEIDADERKVKQILFNLLSNAVKFTPAGGTVTLAARTEGGQAIISVRDTGVGISAEDQARIFEEFYQLGPGMAQEGTGLGLALTKRLVDLHGGELTLESAPGAGSTFTVRLPLHRPGATPTPGLIPGPEPVSA